MLFRCVVDKRGSNSPLLFPGAASTSNNAEAFGAAPVEFIPMLWAFNCRLQIANWQMSAAVKNLVVVFIVLCDEFLEIFISF
ncbi:MAG: hypothetical protein CVT95_09355 [Bacteroidetes bacterium HGW-Bacteroidetes-12]|nr:MAG: hypothetical protein CVT95_09355 [Bacteroidetes bacterium HGW-Bacteroidetes-12]